MGAPARWAMNAKMGNAQAVSQQTAMMETVAQPMPAFRTLDASMNRTGSVVMTETPVPQGIPVQKGSAREQACLNATTGVPVLQILVILKADVFSLQWMHRVMMGIPVPQMISAMQECVRGRVG